MSDPGQAARPAYEPVREQDRADALALQEFFDEGVLIETLGTIRSGKEATVFLCAAHVSVGHRWLAVKVFKQTAHRGFADASAYTAGRYFGRRRTHLAVEKKTVAGREIASAAWVNNEFDTLTTLFEAGADVPEPMFATERAIAMEYIGDRDLAAPRLSEARLAPGQRRFAAGRVLSNIELFLREDVVHGDLSAFNILWDGRRPVVIDFPQAVDARSNPNARALLERDVRNCCAMFGGDGSARPDPAAVVERLWRGYRREDRG